MSQAAQDADDRRIEESTNPPPPELRRMLQRVFLHDADGRAAFALIISRYHGRGPLLNDRMVHEHNVVEDLKNLVGWGHTHESIQAQVELMAARMELIGQEESREATRTQE